MNRRAIIIISVLLALILAALSIGCTLYFSWLNAENIERARLAKYADRTIVRVQSVFDEASELLMQLQRLTAPRCSAQHIEQMRKLTFNSLATDEIGYFENGFLKCNSWGLINEKVAIMTPDIIANNGIKISFNVAPLISKDHLVTSLSYMDYNVLIDPDRFTYIVTDPEINIVIASNKGKILSVHNNLDSQLVAEVTEGKSDFKNDIVYAIKRENITVIASESKHYVMLRWLEVIKMFAPLGILITIAFIAVVILLSRRRLSLLGELKAAIARRELFVHYQPLIELKSGKCIGAEALIRWQRPDGTWIRPDIFIALAEDNNIIQPLTDQVISIVVSDLKNTLNTDKELHISINIAADDFKTGRIKTVLENALDGTGIMPHQIWLEATERSLMDIELVTATLKKQREQGHPILVDDFGTGYSSLSYLQSMPIDIIKIDKSFISALGKESATSHVVHHIIRMAKQLKLKIVAEGVETQEQIDFLKNHEVEYVQGWFYAKAMPLNEFLEFYKRSHS